MQRPTTTSLKTETETQTASSTNKKLTNIFEKQVIIKPKIINKFELHLGFNL